MNDAADRRLFLMAAILLPLTATLPARASSTSARAITRLSGLEKSAGGRLGVAALDTGNGVRIDYRADQRFPLCSTFKLLLIGEILRRSVPDAGLLQQRIHYGRSDIVHYSPVSEKHLAGGMTVAELCKAALQYSDNTAANQLLKLVDGPAALTAFAHSIGNAAFRLDRWETELNASIPGDDRDTATPASMVQSLQHVALGGFLPERQRLLLQDWLRGNTTGGKRIRAAVPTGWQVADKTGSGDYGTVNDIAILWPPNRPPIVLAVYYTQEDQNGTWRDDMISSSARIVLEALDAVKPER
jgi:beta-lactamase class A